MRVLEININKGIITYSTVITGTFIEFTGKIKDKLLTDLSFTDLKHRYKKENVKYSWDTFVEVFDPATSTYSTTLFEKGKNYCYPYIDYAQQFLINDNNVSNSDDTKFHGVNFRPAIWVKEYFNRIFSQEGLNGWSWELKCDDDFREKFNSLIIPYNEEKLQYTFNLKEPYFNMSFKKPIIFLEDETGSANLYTAQYKSLNLGQVTNPPANTIAPYMSLVSGESRMLYTDRTIKSDGLLVVTLSGIHNPMPAEVVFKIQVRERPATNTFSDPSEWFIIGESQFTMTGGQTIAGKTVSVAIGEREFLNKKNIMVTTFITYPFTLFPQLVQYDVVSTELTIPSTSTTKFTAEIRYADGTVFDTIEPQAPANIKQLDFLKSVMSLFNLYAYTKNNNPKHIIFEKYDDYYNLSNPSIITSTATNWTNKFNTDEIKIKSNVSLPKSYTFKYKDDSDWLNADYKKKYDETAGTLNFTDEYGVVDTKKVELIFSPTPIGEDVGTARKVPMLYTIDGGNKKPAKTNIRILYYNGLKPCTRYSMCKDTYTTSWQVTEMYVLDSYPQVSTFWYDNTGKPVEDLHFGRQKEYYFPVDVDYINASSAYSSYYSNQVTELTNPNISTVEAEVILNELDIANLDLKVPVFIDLGSYGHSYFKVLSVEYINNITPAKVVLQKIYLGSKR